MNYNFSQISKVLEKIFKAGYKTEKEILMLNLAELIKIPDLTTLEINIIVDLKKAIKSKKLLVFLSGYEQENNLIEGGMKKWIK